MAPSNHRLLAVVGAASAAVLMCLVIYSGARGARRGALLGQSGLSQTTAVLQKDLARQHNLGSKMKAWVATSAMARGASHASRSVAHIQMHV